MRDPFTTADWDRLLGSIAYLRERLESGDLRQAVPPFFRMAALAYMDTIEQAFERSDSATAMSAARHVSIILNPYVTSGPP